MSRDLLIPAGCVSQVLVSTNSLLGSPWKLLVRDEAQEKPGHFFPQFLSSASFPAAPDRCAEVRCSHASWIEVRSQEVRNLYLYEFEISKN